MMGEVDQLDENVQHPDAIGMRPSEDSPFVTVTPAGISTTTVLLESGSSPVSGLPNVKTKDRPKVYCPFCGRKGKYNKNRDPQSKRLEFFSHLGRDERCVDQDLANVLHRRAIAWIAAQLEIHRQNNWPIRGLLSCRRCQSPIRYTFLSDGFDRIGVEASFRSHEVNRRPDIVIFKEEKPLFAIELALSSYVDEIRQKDLESFGVAGVEIKCGSIFNHLGVSLWKAGVDLPQASIHWQIESSSGRLAICDKCRMLSPDQEAISRLIIAGASRKKDSWQRALAWSQNKLGASYKPDPDKGPLYDLIYAPERLNNIEQERRSEALCKKPAELCNPRQLAHAIFGRRSFGWLDNLDLALMLHDPFRDMGNRLVEQYLKTATMETGVSITEFLEEFENKYLPLLRDIQSHWTTEVTRSEITTFASVVALRKFYAEGSTAFLLDDLVALVRTHFRIERSESVRSAIVEDRAFSQGPVNGYWALSSWASTERMIAKTMVKWGRTLRWYNKNSLPIDLPPDQMEAIHAVLGSRAAIITGGAGTGKTTLVRYILEHSHNNWYLLAPTHRAVATMRTRIEQNHERGYRIKAIQTLEAFLVAHETHHQARSSSYAGCGFVIDEASMIDTFQMARLLEAIDEAARLVLVGDPNQLPSIGPGRVLEDLTGSRALPMGMLTTIRRSGSGSTIALLAGEIAQGRVPGKRLGGDASFIRCSEERLVEEVTRYFIAKKGHVTRSVQIISPYNWLNDEINNSIRLAMHGSVKGRFSPGDRLICMKTLSNRKRPPIHNGVFATFICAVGSGAVIQVDESSTGDISIDCGELKSFRLGWATTVHKAQGTEWPSIVVALPRSAGSGIIDRSLIYTAITRAKNNLVVIGSSQAFSKAVQHRSTERRKTLLGAFVMEALRTTRL